jgi:cell division protein FtsB
LEEKKKQICLRLTEEEKIIIEEKAKAENLTVNAFILKRLLNDSTEMENAINKLSSEIEELRTENNELKRFAKEERESYNEMLQDIKSVYEITISTLKETIKSKQVLIESKETKKGFWAKLFNK